MSEKIEKAVKELISEYGRIQLEDSLLEYGLFPEFSAASPSGGKKLRDGDVFEFKPENGWKDPVINPRSGMVNWTATGGRGDHILEITHPDGKVQIHRFQGNTTVTLISGTTFIWPENAEIKST